VPRWWSFVDLPNFDCTRVRGSYECERNLDDLVGKDVASP
jgi:hypothetical protein